MDLLEAIVLGVIQGLTEFLPISSSGHLLIVPQFFGWDDAGSGFTAVIQLGTLLAVLIYFWADIVQTFLGWTAGFGAVTGEEDRFGLSVADDCGGGVDYVGVADGGFGLGRQKAANA